MTRAGLWELGSGRTEAVDCVPNACDHVHHVQEEQGRAG